MDLQKIVDLDMKFKQLEEKVIFYQDVHCNTSDLVYDITDLEEDVNTMKVKLGDIKLKLDSLRRTIEKPLRKLDDHCMNKQTRKQTKSIIGKRKAEKDKTATKKLKDEVTLPECKENTVISVE